MKIWIIAPVVIAALAGASSVGAQTKGGSEPGTSVGMAPTSTRDAVAERENFTQKAHDEVRVWQQRIQDFDAKMQVKATEAETRASKDLDSAWTATKTASARLETAGEKDWDSAKASFNTASNKLDSAWHKAEPTGK